MTTEPAVANLPMDRPRRKRGWWGWTKLLLKLAVALVGLVAMVALIAQAIFDRQALTNLSPQGRQEIVPNSSHGLPFEHPEAVVAAVKSVLRN